MDTDGDPPRYIPQDVGELRDFLTSFMSAAPTFVDPDFTWMTIDTQFLTLHDGLQVVRARIYLASNKPNDAIVNAEHALALHQRAKSEGVGAANAKFVLARALRDANGDRARALQLATEAAAHWTKLGNDLKRKDVEDWLATHESWLRGPSGPQ